MPVVQDGGGSSGKRLGTVFAVLQKWLSPSTLMASGKLGLIIHSAVSGKGVASWVSRFEMATHSAQDTKKKGVISGSNPVFLVGWSFFGLFLLLTE